MAPKSTQPPINIQTIEKVEAVGGIVEATLHGFFHGMPDHEGTIRLRFEFLKAKEFSGQLNGALIVAQTQIARKK